MKVMKLGFEVEQKMKNDEWWNYIVISKMKGER